MRDAQQWQLWGCVLGGGNLQGMKTTVGGGGLVKSHQPVRNLPWLRNTVLCVLSSVAGHLWKILTRLDTKRKNQVLHKTEVFNMPDFS